MTKRQIPASHGQLDVKVSTGGPDWVLLLHGKIFTYNDWGLLPDALQAAGCSVLAIDFAGYGESTGMQDPALYASDIADALRWIEQQKPRSIRVIGASMGALALLRWAREHGDISLSAALLFAPRDVSAGPSPANALYCVYNQDEVDAARHTNAVREHLPHAIIDQIPGSEHAQANFTGPHPEHAIEVIMRRLLPHS